MRIFNTKAELMSMLSTLNLQEEEAAYIKSYPKYVVGYSNSIIQIIKGRLLYSGMRDIGTYIESYYYIDLPSIIEIHTPVDLSGYLNIFNRNYLELPVNIYAWQYKDLTSFLNTMRKQDLQSIINPIPYIDLPIYLKVWPQTDLPSYLYGWQKNDLTSFINTMSYTDLNIYIGTHIWIDLNSRIKGLVIEEYKDIYSIIDGFTYEDLPIIIRATYFNSINSTIYPVQPIDLSSIIDIWHISDLNSIIDCVDSQYDLKANITAVGDFRNLNIYIKTVLGINNYIELPASIYGFVSSTLSSIITCIEAPNLTAYINAIGSSSSLSASIYPKRIRLSTLLSVSTLESRNLSAIINASCKGSMYANLSSFIRSVYSKDITSYIKSLNASGIYSNLGASIGRHNNNIMVDKLPINITLPNYVYREMDKINIYIRMFNGISVLPVYINGIQSIKDISSSITGSYLKDYSFKNSKNWERVYDLEYYGEGRGKEDVEMSFKSVVNNYFFVNAESKLYKIDELDRWVVNVRSFTNVINRIKVKRKLHREKLLYDLDRFNNIDEAVRFVIDYVTDIPHSDLSSYIYTYSKFVDLNSSIKSMYKTSDNSTINSSITGVQSTIAYSSTNNFSIL